MAIDIADLLAQVDLLALASRDTPLKRVASTGGGEWAGPCPKCGGRDRFRVWPDHPGGRGRWFCRQCHEKRGDAIDYRCWLHNETYPEALAALGLDAGALSARQRWQPMQRVRPGAATSLPGPLAPPGPKWQRAARAFVAYVQARLWDRTGAEALAYLRWRGLTDETIRHFGLGYNPTDLRRDPQRWGLESDPTSKQVWLPRGVVIPWEIGGELWRVNIRLLEPRRFSDGRELRYIGPRGCKNGLYNADALSPDCLAIVVEGEIDVLTLIQTAGDLVVAVATGSTSGARRTRWIARLALASLVLVAFDADDKGDKAADYWLDVLPNARRWRPLWGDANAMAQGGADLRAWVLAALDEPTPSPVEVEA